jgi:hypothetical protein
MDDQDDEDNGDPGDPAHRHFLKCGLIELEDAKGAADFYISLSRMIRHANTLDTDQLAQVAEIASKPWSRPVTAHPLAGE